jgi:pyridoxamine 5'-phosphate oxidase
MPDAAMQTDDPMLEFHKALARAEASGDDPSPMALATADGSGRPSVRIVLLRGTDARGLVFYTNYNSRKARELERNPRAALCLHWPRADEQVRVEGTIERLPDEESDTYFAGRPRGHQLSAWASQQSEELASREMLERRYGDLERRFEGLDVPRPPFWGGYRLVAERIEFWQGRPDRLHDRVVYVRDGGAWRRSRLYP